MTETMQILMRSQGPLRQIAAVSGGHLLEYIQEEGPAGTLVGSIVLGTVENVLPGVGAAFVKIGQPQNGFLPLSEQESFMAGQEKKALATGQEVLVQVKKDPVREKGAFLTRDIALAGQYVLLMPNNRHVGVSSRIVLEEERAYALALGKQISGEQAGVIVRQAALWARQEDVQAEWEGLVARWQEILQKAAHQKPPATLFQEPSALEAMLRDYGKRYQVTVHSHEGPESNEVQLDALWQGLAIDRQLREAMARKVLLPGGGTLVIDEREALTTLDVNSGRFLGTGKQGQEGPPLALAQNLEACPDIARQIRLRNLSGILIIDFIDMDSAEQQAQVIQALQQALAEDRAKTVIHGFTKLGLLEMTRKRTRESLGQMLGAKQPPSHSKSNKRKEHQA